MPVTEHRTVAVALAGTDGWWKHAVTTEATVVEATRGKQAAVTPYVLYYWTLVADVTDPGTGQVVRAEGTTCTKDIFRPGETIKVRWSAKRKTFDLYSRTTVPEDEWEADHLGGSVATRPPSQASLAGAGLSADEAARVEQALGALGVGNIADIQVERRGATDPAASQHDPIEQLEKLAALHDSGALTDEEFAQEKRRVLGGQ